MPSNSEFERCFLTGGAGFIGSHMVERLLANPVIHRYRIEVRR